MRNKHGQEVLPVKETIENEPDRSAPPPVLLFIIVTVVMSSRPASMGLFGKSTEQLPDSQLIGVIISKLACALTNR